MPSCEGQPRIDAGAERALLRTGRLPIAVGHPAVEGEFSRREAVRLLPATGGNWPGPGILSSEELRQIMGPQRDECRANWGLSGDAVVHRISLVLHLPSRLKQHGRPNQRAQLGPRACLTRSI